MCRPSSCRSRWQSIINGRVWCLLSLNFRPFPDIIILIASKSSWGLSHFDLVRGVTNASGKQDGCNQSSEIYVISGSTDPGLLLCSSSGQNSVSMFMWLVNVSRIITSIRASCTEIGLLTFHNGGIFLDSYAFIVKRAPFWIVFSHAQDGLQCRRCWL